MLSARSSRARVVLERDRHARGCVVLAQRVADPVVGHEDAGEVGVARERRCRTGRRPRARRSRARVERREARDRRVVGRDLRDQRGCAGCAGARGSWRRPRSARARRPATATRSTSVRWSTAVTSRQLVNCCSSRRNVADVGPVRRGRRTRPAGRASRGTPRRRSARSIAAATSSHGGARLDVGLCSSSRGRRRLRRSSVSSASRGRRPPGCGGRPGPGRRSGRRRHAGRSRWRRRRSGRSRAASAARRS